MSNAESKTRTVETNACPDKRSGSEPPNGPSGELAIRPRALIAEAGASSEVPARKATGPRTKLGKQRSRANAVKHGVFSAVVMREGEHRSAFEALNARLKEAIQPVGGLEAILVEKLAVLFWRYRRFVEAEAGEIALKEESIRYGDAEDRIAAVVDDAQQPEVGLILSVLRHGSPAMLDDVIERLRELHRCIEKDGLSWQRDRQTLKRLYGTLPEDDWRWQSSAPPQTHINPEPAGLLAKEYRQLRSAPVTDTDSLTKGVGYLDLGGDSTTDSPAVSPAQAKTRILDLVGEEIRRLESVRLLKERWAKMAAAIPPIEVSERLLRYEASLERSIDRTMAQLERLRRMRLGQPVPPSIQVQVSA